MDMHTAPKTCINEYFQLSNLLMGVHYERDNWKEPNMGRQKLLMGMSNDTKTIE